MKEACKKLFAMGVENVLIKGGHLRGEALDILYDGTDFQDFKTKKIGDTPVHGTGCIFSSAIASEIARGNDLVSSIKSAKSYIFKGISHSLQLGSGYNFFNHFK